MAILNNSAVNRGTCISLQLRAFVFFRKMPRSGVGWVERPFKCPEVVSAGSSGRSVCNILGKPRSLFCSSYTSRPSYHHCIVRVPFSFHPWTHLLFVVCLAEPTLNNLTGVRCVSRCVFSWRFILMNSIRDQPISK